MSAEQNEELFARFFNHESVLVADMEIGTLDEHIQELELIMFEARVRHQAANKKKREDIAKLSKEQREALITRPDINASERSKPLKRRLTHADKVIEGLANLGVDLEMIAAITKNLQNSAAPVVSGNNVVAAVTLPDKIEASNRASFNAPKPNVSSQEQLLAEQTLDLSSRILDTSDYFAAPSPAELDRIANAATTAAHLAHKILCTTCGEIESKHIPFVGCLSTGCKKFTKV